MRTAVRKRSFCTYLINPVLHAYSRQEEKGQKAERRVPPERHHGHAPTTGPPGRQDREAAQQAQEGHAIAVARLELAEHYAAQRQETPRDARDGGLQNYEKSFLFEYML
jgi:hypothetical protein